VEKTKISLDIITDEEDVVNVIVDTLDAIGYNVEFIKTQQKDNKCLIVLKKGDSYENF
jgi:hypothetical protein